MVVDADLVRAELERRALRDATVYSTSKMAEYTGSNSYDQSQDIYPWARFSRDIADYLDSPNDTIGKPIKTVAVSRGHLKTEVALHALARYALLNPEKRCCIIGAAADRAEKNLAKITSMYLNRFQGVFPELVNPKKVTKEWIELNRKGDYKEHTIETFGRTSKIAGRHYNGVIWLDDLVTEQDDFEANPDISEKISRLFTHVLDFVADPGCEIWVTYTRYHVADPYGPIIDPDGEFFSSIVGGGINLDCYDHSTDPPSALYPFRHCIKKEDEVADVEFEGKIYPKVRRQSLEQMEKRMSPQEWYSQMLNRPMVGEVAGFAQEQFEQSLPCRGATFESWFRALRDDDYAVYGFGAEARKAPIVTTVVGDPSYGKGRSNDYCTLFAIAQLSTNQWIILEAFRERLGYERMDEYIDLALRWKEDYGAVKLGIEKHAREILETLFQEQAARQGRYVTLADLPANSNTKKKDRISRLIPIFSEMRVYWCDNTESVRKATLREAMTFPNCCDGGRGMHDDCLDGLANATQTLDPRSGRPRKRLRFGGKHRSFMERMARRGRGY